jgi:hypothetical protein
MIRFIEGLVHHLQDSHEFCEHNHNKLEYTPLRRGGLAARDLEEGLREFALANKMCFYTRCRESACVEGLHRLNIKYACKTFFFGLSFIIRVALAQLDWNSHRYLYFARIKEQRARKQEVGALSEPSAAKSKKVRVEKKPYNFRSEIMKRIFYQRNAMKRSWDRYVHPLDPCQN